MIGTPLYYREPDMFERMSPCYLSEALEFNSARDFRICPDLVNEQEDRLLDSLRLLDLDVPINEQIGEYLW